MAPEKKNEFLDVADSDEENDVGYDSEDDDLRKGGRSAKRRKLDDSDESGLESDGERDGDIGDEESDEETGGAKLSGDEQDENDDEDEKTAAKQKKRSAKDQAINTDALESSRPLTKKNLVATEAAIKKSGVVYMSRIPPFMKPVKLRHLLEPYGAINRMFLSPEDPTARTRRVKAGGNKKKLFTEGWVEFVRKKDAKAVCELLNARPIGGKKSSYYRDDIWNLLYLRGFKWHNLTEQIAAENAERESRMRAELSKTARENKEFVRNVEKAKMFDGMQAKAKAKKRKAADAAGEGRERGAEAAGGSEQKTARSFKQVPLAKKRKEVEDQPADVTRVLSKIF